MIPLQEAKATEVEVLKVTVEQLKAAYSQINNNGGEKKVQQRESGDEDGEENGNGWDDFDVDDSLSSPSAAAAMPGARVFLKARQNNVNFPGKLVH